MSTTDTTSTNPPPLTPAQRAAMEKLQEQDRAAAQGEAEAARKESIAALEPLIPVVGTKEWAKLRADLEAFMPTVATMMADDPAGFHHLNAATQGLKHFEAWFLSKVGATATPPNPPA